MKLYHRDIYMPKLTLKDETIRIGYTVHAQDEAINDRYVDYIEMPSEINLSKVDIFEIGIIEGKIAKIVFRMEYNEEYDLCMVLMTHNLKIKTLWLNSVDDKHKTLNHDKYEKCPHFKL